MAIVTCGITWIIVPFFAYSEIEKAYLRKGWVKYKETPKVEIQQTPEQKELIERLYEVYQKISSKEFDEAQDKILKILVELSKEKNGEK